MHLDEERIQRLQDGELGPAVAAAARAHLAECAACRQLLQQTEREEQELVARLRLLDHPQPALRAESIARASRRRARPVRWAAAVLLGLAVATAAYAAPGSPLPRWIRAILSTGEEPAPVRISPESGTAAAIELAGIAVAPGAAMVIDFPSAPPQGQAQVSLVEETAVEVRAPMGTAMFSADADRVVVRSTAPAITFQIRIPRAAPRVEIRVAGRQVFLSQRGRTSAEGPGGPDGYLLPLDTSRP
jgi:anti-sigma factor RsiW